MRLALPDPLSETLHLLRLTGTLYCRTELTAPWGVDLPALRDEQVGRVLAAIHRAPEKDWSVAVLAKEVGMSRSGFSARFTDLVGESAMRCSMFGRFSRKDVLRPEVGWPSVRQLCL